MLTGRGSDIFEVWDEPLRHDDPSEMAGNHGEGADQVGASSTPSARTRSRLFALGCLIAGVAALGAVVPRDTERSANDVETHASTQPSHTGARPHLRAPTAPRVPRQTRQPRAKRIESRRRAAPVSRKHFPSRTRLAAPSGADTAVLPTPQSAPVDVSHGALAAPYEEFGFER